MIVSSVTKPSHSNGLSNDSTLRQLIQWSLAQNDPLSAGSATLIRCLDPLPGSTAWIYCSDPLLRSTAWIRRRDPLPRSTTWIRVWIRYLDPLNGSADWIRQGGEEEHGLTGALSVYDRQV